MATTPKLILDLRRMKKDNTYPIALRITHQRVPIYIIYEYSVKPEDWNDVGFYIEKSCKKYSDLSRINNFLTKQRVAAVDTIDKLKTSGELENLSPADLKYKIINRNSKTTFRTYTENIILQMKTAKQLGNASVYQQALDFVDRHCDKKDYTFDQFNYNLLKHLEAKHLSKDNSLNSLSFYFRTIRAIYNRAIKEGIASRDNYPFSNYSIKETKTLKRAIPKTDIDKIRDAQFEPGTNIWHAHNYFMFSFYNIGMNFADIAFLKLENLIDGRISYTRAKTGKHYSIKISEPTKAILDLYTPDKKPTDFIFPIIQRKTPELQMLDLMNERKTYNKWLKKIATSVGIQSNLTSYVARHSWATIAKDLNVPISVISEGLGHEDIKTTQIYLDSFDDDVIDKANELIIS